LTGIQYYIRQHLDLWNEHRITPFFIFDGQSLIGQDEITLKRARAANQKTDQAWELYLQTEGEQAVTAFGDSPGMRSLSGAGTEVNLLTELWDKVPFVFRIYTLSFKVF
jgi:hypothetical protein